MHRDVPQKAQKQYADNYNAKLSDEQFEIEQVIYLSPASTRKMLGPSSILHKKSSHSYVIIIDGVPRTEHVTIFVNLTQVLSMPM